MKLVSMAEHEQLRGLWPQSYEFFFKYSLFSPLKMQKADILNLFCSKAVTFPIFPYLKIESRTKNESQPFG
jgi:hypothetical protein